MTGLRQAQEGVLAIVSAIIALAGHRQLHTVGRGAVLLVLGIIIGGLGGILVLVGLIAIVTIHSRLRVGPG